MSHEPRKITPAFFAGSSFALLILQGCSEYRPTANEQDHPAGSTRIEKKSIAGCWNEVLNPISDYYCVDLCFSLKYDDFKQLVATPDKVHYRKEWDVLGLEWVETVDTRALKAYGTYSLSGNKLHRRWSFPDRPNPDSAENFRADTELRFRKDTLEISGHLYLRADSLLNCGTDSPWATFDPDPPSGGGGGGGGGGDWD